jgi:hypothetical protein
MPNIVYLLWKIGLIFRSTDSLERPVSNIFAFTVGGQYTVILKLITSIECQSKTDWSARLKCCIDKET